MKYRVGCFYQNPKYFGLFRCVARIDGEGYFRLLDEENMRLHEEMKTSEDGAWIEVDTENVPQKYHHIEE